MCSKWHCGKIKPMGVYRRDQEKTFVLVINSQPILHPLFSGADTAVQQITFLLCQPAASQDLPGTQGGGQKQLDHSCLPALSTAWPQQYYLALASNNWFHFPAFFYPPKQPQHTCSASSSGQCPHLRGLRYSKKPNGTLSSRGWVPALRNPRPSFRVLNDHLLLPFTQP